MWAVKGALMYVYSWSFTAKPCDWWNIRIQANQFKTNTEVNLGFEQVQHTKTTALLILFSLPLMHNKNSSVLTLVMLSSFIPYLGQINSRDSLKQQQCTALLMHCSKIKRWLMCDVDAAVLYSFSHTAGKCGLNSTKDDWCLICMQQCYIHVLTLQWPE